MGVPEVLEALVQRLPPPTGERDAPLQALLVDSWYDPYLGVITLVRVKNGVIRKGMRIRMMANNAVYDVDDVGIFKPKKLKVAELGPGQIGYINAAIKTDADCQAKCARARVGKRG